MPSNQLNKHTLCKRIEYLTTWLYYFYKKQIPTNRHGYANPNLTAPTDGPYIVGGSRQTSKPCFEVLNNNEMPDVEKIEEILNYLNTNCTQNTTQTNNNQFWYKTIDWMDNNPETIQTRNGRQFLQKITSLCYENNEPFWSNEISSIYKKLYTRVTNLTLDKTSEEGKQKELIAAKEWEDVMQYVQLKKKILPPRPTFWRVDSKGVYCETTDPTWHIVGGCGGICTTEPNTGVSKSSDPRVVNICKYWTEKYKDDYKFALEYEFAIPTNNVDRFFEECAKAGLLEKNKITVGSDPTVRYTGCRGLEVNTQPMNYNDAHECWKKLGEIATKCGGKFGVQANAGGHIHVDKPKSTYDQLKIVEKIIGIGEGLPAFFGRGKIVDGNVYEDDYGNYMGLKKRSNDEYDIIYENVLQSKDVLKIDAGYTKELQEKNIIPRDVVVGKRKLTISAYGRGAINVSNKRTIEFRGFNSISNPERNLEVLAKQLGEVLGNDVIYGKKPLPEQTICEFDKGELCKTLKNVIGCSEQEINYINNLKSIPGATPDDVLKNAIHILFENKDKINEQVQQTFQNEEQQTQQTINRSMHRSGGR